MMITERIRQLQKDCVVRYKAAPDSDIMPEYHTSARERFAHLPQWEKAARAMAHAISNIPVIVYPEDGLGGRIYHKRRTRYEMDPTLNWGAIAKEKILREEPAFDILFQHQLVGHCSPGHVGWHWERLLQSGVTALQERVEELLRAPRDEQAAQFYKGVQLQLEAMLSLSDRYADAYEALGNTRLAAMMRKVPRFGAESFEEAVQAFYFQHLVVMAENPHGGNSPGRPDYYLWPYLERDLAAGKCTLERAKELVDELFLRIDERIHASDGWGETLVLGGTRADGGSAVNELTYIMAESMIDLDLTHPFTYLRIPEEGAGERFLALCSRFMLKGHNRAQILSDKAIISAMLNSGKPYGDAVDYMCGGCMEISPQGRSSDFLYAGWVNCMKMLELTVTGGKCLLTGEQVEGFKATEGLSAYPDFESLYTAFIKEARRLIHLYLRFVDCNVEACETARYSYLQSALIDDCLAKGRTMHQGGARYHDYGATPMALPNVADALIAVKLAVFERKICTAEELISALQADFVGYDQLQARLRALPKFGEDDETADAVAARVAGDFADIFLSYKTRHGGTGLPIILTFVFGAQAGTVLGATPDGRKAKSTVAQGLTPYSASMRKGLTAAINSCLRLPFEKMAGGASTMWDFDSAWVSEELMNAVITTFVRGGGQIFQGNTTPVEDLLKAMEHPEEYEHLIVRVGGFSARFVHLDPSVQAEIISRHRHGG